VQAEAVVNPLPCWRDGSVDLTFKTIEKQFGRLDIPVNSATANPYFGRITNTDMGAFQKTVDVNIRGYFFVFAQGAKLMTKNGGGSIINIASVNGVIPRHDARHLLDHQSGCDLDDALFCQGVRVDEGAGQCDPAGCH
jgi:NAD(P)-dependent dehydrogenase (short-subunit alcohol dehydrogenase family)